MKKNIFIEGIPGCGKTTLLNRLNEALPEYQCFREGDWSPVELAWCSYMNQDEYEKALRLFPMLEEEIRKNTIDEGEKKVVTYTKIRTEEPDFYSYMEQFEIYNGRRTRGEFHDIVMSRFQRFNETGKLFECSFFQNIVEELLLYEQYEEEKIFAFYKELLEHVDLNSFLLIRLETTDIKTTIEQIKKERVNEQGEEVWYRMMMEYLNQSPYGKVHQYSTFQDLVDHFTRRMQMEDRIMKELLTNHCIRLESKKYTFEEVIADIKSFANEECKDRSVE
ncbi:P-loop NTPase family protein [Anaerosporobacter faecicola]|uniref:hypothetical protein n=1 Tax=Anaerosporobacter faecicola TaxID=2718714 RepID=UPI00143C72D1|nr:hypothetical protein [Anaerosporobacter faecicola]